MAKLVLNGSTSGSVTLDVPAVSGTTTLTLPSTSGTVVTTNTIPAGSILQVVQATTRNTLSTTSSSLVATGFIGTITPSKTSSKILVMINGGQWRYTPVSSSEQLAQLYRSIGGAAYASVNNDFDEIFISPAAAISAIPHSFVFLDSPATTSAVAYQPYWRNSSGSGTINYNFASIMITMTLIEVAA
jgi:hypothetical protein